jgi:hypothetical protein
MKPFSTIAVAVFALVAVLQLVRLLLGWEVTVAGQVIPLWMSAIACVIAAVLAVLLWRETQNDLRRGRET